jgi:hypothetical protein
LQVFAAVDLLDVTDADRVELSEGGRKTWITHACTYEKRRARRAEFLSRSLGWG